MDPVTEIFAAFDGSPRKLADAVKAPVQTVCDWRRKGQPRIPQWRREAVLAALEEGGKQVSAATRAYLTSGEAA